MCLFGIPVVSLIKLKPKILKHPAYIALQSAPKRHFQGIRAPLVYENLITRQRFTPNQHFKNHQITCATNPTDQSARTIIHGLRPRAYRNPIPTLGFRTETGCLRSACCRLWESLSEELSLHHPTKISTPMPRISVTKIHLTGSTFNTLSPHHRYSKP